MASVLLWLWDHNAGEWQKAPACVTTVRLVAVGQVVAGHHHLYWILTDPSAANNNAALTDDLDGLGAVVLDGFKATQDSFFVPLNPPMCFSTGIYLSVLVGMTSITFGYV